MKSLLIIPVLLVAGLIYITADQGSGLLTWMQDREDLEDSQARITRLETEIARLKKEILSLQTDPFAIESAIREDLRYAGALETVIRVPAEPVTVSRGAVGSHALRQRELARDRGAGLKSPKSLTKKARMAILIRP